ncbi:MAG: hypothetical protein GY873_39815 [Bosea sp.]|uniref:hypothetical protein n=1 Tax=Bosea sp. (in: a-proteobacteria) TaxID=1871050 RepID=UPI00239CB9BD|nr:hypothetical protein [Bosea sp. (in: a-proteobacteria)]MCP4740352.1 hypothetical protein [Bosea sp. (in: a-proteobacteria)]
MVISRVLAAKFYETFFSARGTCTNSGFVTSGRHCEIAALLLDKVDGGPIDQAVGAAQKREMHHDTRDVDRANGVGHGANLPILACCPRTRSRRFSKVPPKLIAKTRRRMVKNTSINCE